MRVLVPGGASYIGAYLVPLLLGDGHEVTVYDTFSFGDPGLPKSNASLSLVKADVRDQTTWKRVCSGKDAIIYLASISREAMCQKYESLAHQVNVEALGPDIEIAKGEGVSRFIYASSVAVYGSTEEPATEKHPIVPTSIYGKHKAECEEIVWKAMDESFQCLVTRSASVCGYSPRMRFDLTINRMIHDAYRLKEITVEGGEQIRSHVTMNDICGFYRLLLETDLTGEAFNIVAENQKVRESAELVGDIIDCGIVVKPRVDDRSYSINGDKAYMKLDYRPKYQIAQAIYIVKAHLDNGLWKDSMTNPKYQNMMEPSVADSAL